MNRPLAPRVTRRTAGVLADGAFKVLLGVAAATAAVPLGRLLGVPLWLMAAAGAALLVCGAVEIACARHRPARLQTRLMVGYDIGWVLTALAGYLLARRGGGAGGELWMGYQTAAPLVFAAVLFTADPAPEASAARAPGTAG
ncbi:hypothetical protein AB0M23_24415 [Streptomyces sp. NPDC052077]|uniref:hypothetical protein n=1 Tax=Streptomyces sp. NPDC052077 TaxID=3154757 RepID=UPI00342FDD86